MTPYDTVKDALECAKENATQMKVAYDLGEHWFTEEKYGQQQQIAMHKRKHDEAIKEGVRALEQMGWRTDMENAPKNGTPYLVWHKDWDEPTIQRYFKYEVDDKAFGGLGRDGRYGGFKEPTHWMPLPAAPKEG